MCDCTAARVTQQGRHLILQLGTEALAWRSTAGQGRFPLPSLGVPVTPIHRSTHAPTVALQEDRSHKYRSDEVK